MAKSTWVFGVLSLLLLPATGITVWHVTTATSPPRPVGDGTSVPLSLPAAQQKNQELADGSSAVLWDTQTHSIRYEERAFERRPIASLTKLMTSMVAIDLGIPWNKTGTILPHEYGPGGNLLLHPGETVRMRDLFSASLLGSANNATKAYIRLLLEEKGMTNDEFIQAMNRKTIALGLEQTVFADPTGLSPKNISTAYEVARLAEYAFANYPDIVGATMAKEYTFTVGRSGREHTIRNTNKLIAEKEEGATGSKTGYLDEAKYCLVMQGAGEQSRYVAAVLGSPSQEENEIITQHLLYREAP